LQAILLLKQGKNQGYGQGYAAVNFGGRRSGMPVQYVLQATSIDKLREVSARIYGQSK
jgi:hypothetical protein